MGISDRYVIVVRSVSNKFTNLSFSHDAKMADDDTEIIECKIASDEEFDSLTRVVLDIMPDLGEGFVNRCLEFYEYSTERVINALFEDRLPPKLNKLDRSLPKLTKLIKPAPVPELKKNVAKKEPSSSYSSVIKGEQVEGENQVLNRILQDAKNVNLDSMKNVGNIDTGVYNKRINSEKQSKTNTANEENTSTAKRSKLQEFENNVNAGKFKYDVNEKLRSMAPMNLFYNKIKDSPRTHKDKRCLYFADLLHPSLGNLKKSLQINFMVDWDWLSMNYEATKNGHKPLTIICGEDASFQAINNGNEFPDVTVKLQKSKIPFGTHHSKMMVFVYDDDSVRVVVHTANLTASDWENTTQGLWVSPKCPKMNDASPDDKTDSELEGDSPTEFKQSLVRYLNSYELPAIQAFISKIKSCDFSKVNAFFVSSIPGSHPLKGPTNPLDAWGHVLVGKILRRHNHHISGSDSNENDVEDEFSVVLQSSSIGSLGGESIDDSFLAELVTSLNVSPDRSAQKLPSDVKVVYPTKCNVLEAYGGPIQGSSCLPYSRDTHNKQTWLKEQMCPWNSNGLNRTQSMPHIKTYIRLSGEQEEQNTEETNSMQARASYFLLTSANLSKAAWGSLSKSKEPKLFIRSYEVGVLLLPRFTHGESASSYSVYNPANRENMFDVTLPYDLLLKKYDQCDEPWTQECLGEIFGTMFG